MGTVAPNARQSDKDAHSNNTDNATSAFSSLQPSLPQHSHFDFGQEIDCPSLSVTESLIPNKMADDDFYHLLQGFNIQQREFLYHVLHCVKTQKTPFHLFLSGGAGVGKTHLVKGIFQALLRYYNSLPGQDPDDIKLVLAAPTGKAAYNIRGATLHSFLAIPASQSLKKYIHLDDSRRNTLRSNFSKLKIIVIDEISMVGADMFQFINARLQEIFQCNLPFGGVSVLCVGDMFQLRPVMDKWVFQNTSSPYQSLTANLWQDLFELYELTIVMRQKDDATFASTLNRIREANHTSDDVSLLSSRVIQSSVTTTYPNDAIHLFTSNSLVEKHNEQIMQTLTTRGCLCVAKDFIIGDVTPSLKETILQLAQQMKPQKTQNLETTLHIKISAKFMLIQNVDTSDGLTNGATCTIMDFSHETVPPTILWVLFDDIDIGEKCRNTNKNLYNSQTDRRWTPIQHIERRFQFGKYKNILVVGRQFPLKHCSATTIHKSQGSSLETAVASFQGYVTPHMMYVALSRLTHLQGLYLLDFNSQKIKVDSAVKVDMLRLRNSRALQIKPMPLYHQTLHQHFKIVFINTRSLHKHIADVRSDQNIKHTNLLIIAETWAINSDLSSAYDIPGFILAKQYNASSPNPTTRPHGGMMIYIEPELILDSYFHREKDKSVLINFEVYTGNRSINMLAVYKHPAQKQTIFTSMLKDIPKKNQMDTIAVGDFNVNQLKPSSDLTMLQNSMKTHFHIETKLLEETTDYHSSLDHIYSNISNISCGVLETYWSDHEGVWIAI